MARSSGITERRDADGRVRFRVQVRRNGQSHTATLGSREAALAFRAQALAATEGRGDPPAIMVRGTLAEVGAVTTIEDACRRLCRELRTRP
jgi:hypothetical protein